MLDFGIVRVSVFAICLAIAAVGVAVTGRVLRTETVEEVESGPIYLPRAEYLRWMSLGYDNVLADILWFRTISYFGRHYRSDRTYPWLEHMCDLVTDLDPRAKHVYRFAGVILPWEANQADAGIRLLKKGARQFPNDWLLQYYLGFDYYFFKNDIDSSLTHLREAMELPGANPSIARLAAVLARHQYGPETTLSFLRELAHNVDSREVRGVVQEQIREAHLAADLQRLHDAVETYRKRTGQLPPSLQALVDADILSSIPLDPFGGGYELDPATGAVRSASGHVPSVLHTSRIRERALRGESMQKNP